MDTGNYAVVSAQTDPSVRVRRARTTSCDPLGTIPDGERWLWQNHDAMQSFVRGKEDARAGRVHNLGSFAQFIDLDIDD